MPIPSFGGSSDAVILAGIIQLLGIRDAPFFPETNGKLLPKLETSCPQRMRDVQS